MQIAIIKAAAADFVKMNTCVFPKTFGHGCTGTLLGNWQIKSLNHQKQNRDKYFRHAINFNRHIDISVAKQSYP